MRFTCWLHSKLSAWVERLEARIDKHNDRHQPMEWTSWAKDQKAAEIAREALLSKRDWTRPDQPAPSRYLQDRNHIGRRLQLIAAQDMAKQIEVGKENKPS